MSRQDYGMQPRGLERALTLVADQAGETDVAEAAWRQGRAARRRGQVLAGALTAGAVAVSALAWSVLPRPEAGPVLPAGDPTVTAQDESRLREKASGVRQRVEAGCLKELGWAVHGTRHGGWTSATVRPRGDEPPRDLRADLAECERVMGMGTLVESSVDTGDLTAADEATLRAMYAEYAEVGRCLEDRAAIAVWVPDEESFVNAYPVGVSPPWHPYSAIASMTTSSVGGHGPFHYAQICPVDSSAWEGR